MFSEIREILRVIGPASLPTSKGGSSSTAAHLTGPFRFLDLPSEVRFKVFELLFSGAAITIYGGRVAKCIRHKSFNHNILRTCHSIRDEAVIVLLASLTLQLVDKRPQDLSHPIPDYYLKGCRKIYILPRLQHHLQISDFPFLQNLLVFVARQELFLEPKVSAEEYEDSLEYSDHELVTDARAGMLRAGLHPDWLVNEIRKSKAERGFSITVCCTIWRKVTGHHLDLEINLDGGELDKVVRNLQVWKNIEREVLACNISGH